jgi:hypothetical protein
MPTTVFGLAVVLLALVSLSVFSLCYTLPSILAGNTTLIATVGLPSPAPPANIEGHSAPPAMDLNQMQNRRVSGIANNRETL